MDRLLEDQQKKLDSELAALQVRLDQDHDEKIQQLQREYTQQQEQLRKEHELALLVTITIVKYKRLLILFGH